MKKEFKNTDSKFTYHQNRACRHCGAPIPDQEHATREFCPVTYDNDGKVRDCKTTYHREEDKPDRKASANLLAKHKAVTTRIDFLVKKKGYTVSTEDLETYEISLHGSVEYNINSDGTLTYVF